MNYLLSALASSTMLNETHSRSFAPDPGKQRGTQPKCGRMHSAPMGPGRWLEVTQQPVIHLAAGMQQALVPLLQACHQRSLVREQTATLPLGRSSHPHPPNAPQAPLPCMLLHISTNTCVSDGRLHRPFHQAHCTPGQQRGCSAGSRMTLTGSAKVVHDEMPCLRDRDSSFAQTLSSASAESA